VVELLFIEIFECANSIFICDSVHPHIGKQLETFIPRYARCCRTRSRMKRIIASKAPETSSLSSISSSIASYAWAQNISGVIFIEFNLTFQSPLNKRSKYSEWPHMIILCTLKSRPSTLIVMSENFEELKKLEDVRFRLKGGNVVLLPLISDRHIQIFHSYCERVSTLAK
jgi:hypothetical protein